MLTHIDRPAGINGSGDPRGSEGLGLINSVSRGNHNLETPSLQERLIASIHIVFRGG